MDQSDKPLPPTVLMKRWRRVAQFAVGASVVLAVAFAALLLFGEPPKQCPNWHLPNARSSSLWVPFFLCMGLILPALIVMIARWEWIVGKAIEVDYPTMTPVPYRLLIIVLMGCSASQFPWTVLVSNCWR